MQVKIAVMNIMIKSESMEAVSSLIHDYRQYVIGRMGIPYRLGMLQKTE